MNRPAIGMLALLAIAHGAFLPGYAQYANQTSDRALRDDGEWQRALMASSSSAYRGLIEGVKGEEALPSVKERGGMRPLAVLGQTFSVTTTDDSGPGSLRQAILDANGNPGLDAISFAIPASGVVTIAPINKLPDLTDPVVIDGTTQPGYVSSPVIMIDGSLAPAGTNAFVVTGGSSTLRGLAVGNFRPNGNLDGFAIVLDAVGGNTVEGCYLGTDAAGGAARPNGSGIGIFGGSGGNLIGGSGLAARNICCANLIDGIQVSTGSAGGNRIQGNYIGVAADGVTPLGNQANGIFVDASRDTLGGGSAGEGNVVVDNGYPGIYAGKNAAHLLIAGNAVGCKPPSYSLTFGNHSDGIVVTGSDSRIGGEGAYAGNAVAANAGGGIVLMGETATRDTVLNNYAGGFVRYQLLGNTSPGNAMGIYLLNAPRNYLAGNVVTMNAGDGIVVKGSKAAGNVFEGNILGPTGSFSVSGFGNNGNGMRILDAPGNIIGGPTAGLGNTISVNGLSGLVIEGDTARGNIVQQNTVGFDPWSFVHARAYWGNKSDGIVIAADSNTIRENAISYNHGCGIVDSLGAKNRFQRNAIAFNDSMGIDLFPRGLTPNDVTLDGDEGANRLQNYPILDSISFRPDGSVVVHGRIQSDVSARIRIEFFRSDTCDATKFGEGEVFLGDTTVMTDALGSANFDAPLPGPATIRDYFTATATDSEGNTSEFARGLRMLDSDGDGLLDIWEEKGGGIDWNADGKIDLDLWSLKARPTHKDLFVEVDWMSSTIPLPGALSLVSAAFNRAPNSMVHNPDGLNGIYLHVETEPSDPPIGDATWYTDPWASFFVEKRTHFGTTALRANPNWANMLQARLLVYRYCIFAVDYDAAHHSSGLAHSDGDPVLGGTLPASDFFVSLGAWRGVTARDQAGTFMHELGHTLGLGHGGSDHVHYKPNYLSVMNYLWQTPSDEFGQLGWRLGYSEWRLRDLDEHNLFESDGLNPGNLRVPTAIVPYQRALAAPSNIGLARLQARNCPVDWDGNADSSGSATRWMSLNRVSFDVPDAPDHFLRGSNDWEALKYDFRSSVGFFDRGTAVPTPLGKVEATGFDELTPAILDSLRRLPPYGILEPASDWSTTSSSGVPVAYSPDGIYLAQPGAAATSDGQGGSFVSWRAARADPIFYEAGLQHVDSLGSVLWPSTGLPAIAPGEMNRPATMMADGSGGAYIVICRGSKPGTGGSLIVGTRVSAQRVDASGTLLWGEEGRQLSLPNQSPDLLEYSIACVSDGTGGVIVVWGEMRNGTYSLFAQRLDPAGTVLWTPGGVVVATAAPTQNLNLNYGASALAAVPDDSSGVIVSWVDGLKGIDDNDIRAQRINAHGDIMWGSQGSAIRVASGSQAGVGMAQDGTGGAYITWVDAQRLGYPYYTLQSARVFVQRITKDGLPAWAPAGVAVRSTPSYMFSPKIVGDHAGGVIVVWSDMPDFRVAQEYLLAQRLNRDGSRLWQSDGNQITNSMAWHSSPGAWTHAIASPSGAVVAWLDANDSTFFLQDVDTSGTNRWQAGGVPAVTQYNALYGEIALVTDGRRGAVVYYEDAVTRDYIYVQHVTAQGDLGGSPLSGILDRTPEKPMLTSLDQNYPNPFNPTTTIQFTLATRSRVSLRIYNILGQEVASLLNEERAPGAYRLVWNAAGNASGVYFCRIQALGTDGTQFNQTKKLILLR